ncbi:AAA family ATPase [Sphingobium tyrosinilyticum]|uniref:AAA family ATPase n=1 Tax=Sphingobium tyrosinilyticum TaxID=2715436 RepID=A0ABV9F1K4_9SPHN
MKDEEFRAWMQAHGQAPNTISTRIADARRVETNYGDLDEAFEADGFAAILEDLAYSAEDNAAGKPNTSKIQIDGDAYKSLASYRSALSVYRQFRENGAGPSDGQSQADRIRAFVLRQIVEPARRAGEHRFAVRAGDVHKQMGLQDAMPAVCSAIGSRKFQALAAVRLVRREGPENSSTTAFTFERVSSGSFDVSRAEAMLRGRYGNSDVDSQKMVSFTLVDGRALALQKDISKVQLWLEDDEWAGPPPAQEVQSYAADKGRHSNLPGRLSHAPPFDIRSAGFPKAVLSVRASSEGELFKVLDWYDSAGNRTDHLQIRNAASTGSAGGTTVVRPTNLILYGPPGTGKTFATAEEAVRLCDGSVPASRRELKARYDALMEAGQIGFVTFHQSYAYEDFVEGLRPVTGDEDGVESQAGGFRLEPRRGVFREISALAEQARKSAGRSGGYDVGDHQFFKMSLGRAGAEDHIYDAAIEGGYIVLGWGGEVDWSDPRYEDYQAIFDKWNEIEPGTKGNSGNISQVWRFRDSMREGDIVIVSEGNSHFRAIGEITGPYRYEPTGERNYNHRRPVRWLLVLDEALPIDTIYDGTLTRQSCYLLKEAKVKKEALSRLLPSDAPADPSAPDQFVLIIDEINRANISKVFGELITLIEPDKRLGESNELRLKLPYSGDTFGVPANLHIVGTMNTADRSIALLDTALRRRFRFKELMPNPDLVPDDIEGINVKRLLRILNDRIEYLFDREHQIGHAYFLGCTTKDSIDEIMRAKVIPLLAEYFYENWERVRQALGEIEDDGGFILRRKLAPLPAGEGDYLNERWRYTVRNTFSHEAYRQLTG